MKDNDRLYNDILRQDADALSARRQRRLAKALADDPELRAFQETLDNARHTLQAHPGDCGISDFTRSQILAEAERRQRRRAATRRIVAPRGRLADWRPALVYGGLAILLVAVGALLFQPRPTPDYTPMIVQPAAPEATPLPAWDELVETELADMMSTLSSLADEVEELVWLNEYALEEAWAEELLLWEQSI